MVPKPDFRTVGSAGIIAKQGDEQNFYNAEAARHPSEQHTRVPTREVGAILRVECSAEIVIRR